MSVYTIISIIPLVWGHVQSKLATVNFWGKTKQWSACTVLHVWMNIIRKRMIHVWGGKKDTQLWCSFIFLTVREEGFFVNPTRVTSSYRFWLKKNIKFPTPPHTVIDPIVEAEGWAGTLCFCRCNSVLGPGLGLQLAMPQECVRRSNQGCLVALSYVGQSLFFFFLLLAKQWPHSLASTSVAERDCCCYVCGAPFV